MSISSMCPCRCSCHFTGHCGINPCCENDGEMWKNGRFESLDIITPHEIKTFHKGKKERVLTVRHRITEETKIPCTMCNGEGKVPTVRSGYKKMFNLRWKRGNTFK